MVKKGCKNSLASDMGMYHTVRADFFWNFIYEEPGELYTYDVEPIHFLAIL